MNPAFISVKIASFSSINPASVSVILRLFINPASTRTLPNLIQMPPKCPGVQTAGPKKSRTRMTDQCGSGVIVQGYCPGIYCPGGILSEGIFPGEILSGVHRSGALPGVDIVWGQYYCPGGYCPDAHDATMAYDITPIPFNCSSRTSCILLFTHK